MSRRVLALAAASGYLSLSQEILWYRAVSYATAAAPSAFAYLLGLFLLGIALGALAARRVTTTLAPEQTGPTVASLFALSALVAFFALPAAASALQAAGEGAVPFLYAAAGLSAVPMGVLFPVLCHAAVPADAPVGRSLAGVYLANVAGAVLGPLFTTFVLMDVLTLAQLSLALALLGLAVALLTLAALPGPTAQRARTAVGLVLAAGLVGASFPSQYASLLERLHLKDEFDPAHPYGATVETRAGIVAVESLQPGAILWGGGVWDGAFNTDLVNNHNNVQRALAPVLFHNAPRDVLVIGLASGSWAWVVAQDPRVQSLTLVEINPGYLQVIPKFEPHRELLSDPRVQVVIDDGRRWLENHPERKFDYVVSNTTFHWREHSTSLLSEEFLRLVQQHLKPGGGVVMNVTGLEDARFTAAKVFQHVARFDNSVVASDAPIAATDAQRRERLLALGLPRRPLLPPDAPAATALVEQLATRDFPDEAATLRSEPLRVITDDNMLPEYGNRPPLYRADWSWLALWRRVQDRLAP